MSEPANYASGQIPADYRCHECGATGCKLWREYQTFQPRILCVNCACAIKNIDPAIVDEGGCHESEFAGPCDQIGWYVPCVPLEEGGGWWGYTSVPDAGVAWWKALPTHPKKETSPCP